MEDVPARLVMTFRGEGTPVVGCTGLSTRERTRAPAPGAWVVLSADPRDAQPRGDRERAATSWDPRILTLPDLVREWLDLEADFELESSMGTDLGVLGEGCASMGVISVVEWRNKENSGGEGLNEEEGGFLPA